MKSISCYSWQLNALSTAYHALYQLYCYYSTDCSLGQLLKMTPAWLYTCTSTGADPGFLDRRFILPRGFILLIFPDYILIFPDVPKILHENYIILSQFKGGLAPPPQSPLDPPLHQSHVTMWPAGITKGRLDLAVLFTPSTPNRQNRNQVRWNTSPAKWSRTILEEF